MENPRPFEVIAAPYTVYWAPVGSTFPLVSAAPASPWVLLGTNGADSYHEDGVTIAQEEEIELFRGLASTAPLKAFRTSEDLMVRLRLADLSLEQYRMALNMNLVSEIAQAPGVPGQKIVGLHRGAQVKQVALLVRGPVSAYGAEDLNSQWEIPRAAITGNPEIVHQKGIPVGLDLEFMAMRDLDAVEEEERFGRVVMQTTPPGA